HLRAGQYPEAVRTSRRALRVDSGWGKHHVLNWMTLALAHHHQGDAEEARTWWEKARAVLDAEEKALAETGKPSPPNMDWVDWLSMRQLRAEIARAMSL